MLLVRHLLSLPPRETWRLLRRRLPLLRRSPAWSPRDLLYSIKHRNGIRFAELLLRQEAILRRIGPWEALDFQNKRVVEVGCGPLAGYGPLTIFCGASAFESAEPEWDKTLFRSEQIANEYLYPLYADLSALYGPRMEFSEFRAALDEKMIIHRAGMEAAPVTRKADIVLSQSCLEHVFPLEDTVAKLAGLQTDETRFVHLVDFGNHRMTANPFEGLYEQPPNDYIARRGRAINLLRVNNVEELFEGQGIETHTVPSRALPHTYRGTIHPWWRERYDDDALFTHLALVASTSV